MCGRPFGEYEGWSPGDLATKPHERVARLGGSGPYLKEGFPPESLASVEIVCVDLAGGKQLSVNPH